jgi:replicative DNA helicase
MHNPGRKHSKTKLPDRQLDQLKVPPHSIEAEQSVIGGLMLDNKAWDRIADRITAQDFYRTAHGLIFEILSELAEKNTPFDVLTVSEALKNIHKLEQAGGEIYLFELAKNTPSAANIVAYADIVRERSVLRQLIEAANSIASTAYNAEGRTSYELLDEAEREIFHIAEQRNRGKGGPIKISHLMADAVNHVDDLYHSKKAITGIATGFADLDRQTSGLQKGDLVIVAGRPSMGKTVLAMNIAEHAAIKLKKGVLFFSMEMSAASLAMRIMSSLCRIDQLKVRTGKLNDHEWGKVTSSVGWVADARLFIDDTPALSPTELRARARRLAREQEDLSLIVIDYLQLMQVPGNKENRATEISEISRSLKALAKELQVPVIAISQLNRGLEQRQERRPVMSDLRESGSLEQDADLILFIYRDAVYNKESDKEAAEVNIAKQRNGPIGTIELRFHGQYSRFENSSKESDEVLPQIAKKSYEAFLDTYQEIPVDADTRFRE